MPARYTVRFLADDHDAPENGGEWQVIDTQAQPENGNVMASYGVGCGRADDGHNARQEAAARDHARRLDVEESLR